MDQQYEGNVMQFNVESQNWEYAGGIKGQSTINIVKVPSEGCYKLVGKRQSDSADGKINFGIKFQNSETTTTFYDTVEKLKATVVPCERVSTEPPRSSLPVPPPPVKTSPSLPPVNSASLQAPPCPIPPPPQPAKTSTSLPSVNSTSLQAPPCPVPPPPPPPHAVQLTKAQDLGQKNLSEASGNGKIRDTEKPVFVESKPPPAAGGGDMMSEMAARLQRRKNMIDSKVEPGESMPGKSNKPFVQNFGSTPSNIESTKITEATPSFSSYKQQESLSRLPMPKRQGSESLSSTITDLDSLKNDMMEFFKVELQKAKEEIIDGSNNS
ncbi:hypothetical protein MXB_1461 [Myxobolus squamalis]|nr:hypothetical protein MXB_1461 [Myxobolus squamalis]